MLFIIQITNINYLIIPIWAFVCILDYFYFLSNFGNLSVASLLACIVGDTQPSLVFKKRKLSRTFIYLFSFLFKFPSLFLSQKLFKHPAIFKWQFNLTLADFFLLADYSSMKLTSEKVVKSAKIMTKDYKYLTSIQNLLEMSFNLFCTIQKVKFTTNINIIQLDIFMKSLFLVTNDLLL